MGKRFDASRLFEAWRRRKLDPKLDIFPDEESSLDAVRSRRKGLSMFSTVVGAIADPGFTTWLDLAFERDLVVTLHKTRIPKWKLEQHPLTIFMSRPEELWRVPAFLAQQRTAFVDGRWSDASENLRSHLLGYTDKQRKRWFEFQRQDKPAWTCATVFALLTASQRKTVESVSRRCFGPTESADGIVLFFHRGAVLKKNALAQVPSGYTLARVGLRWEEFYGLFGTWKTMKKRGLIERKLTRKIAPVINAGLLSNVQFLSRSGWH